MDSPQQASPCSVEGGDNDCRESREDDDQGKPANPESHIKNHGINQTQQCERSPQSGADQEEPPRSSGCYLAGIKRVWIIRIKLPPALGTAMLGKTAKRVMTRQTAHEAIV